jgi:heme/copper-type cytochrome/quinol oxidase subunit 2
VGRTMQSKIRLSLIGGGLPLLVYPGVLLAGAMSLAAEGTAEGMGPVLMRAIFTCFLIGTIIYPLVYIPYAIAAVRLTRNQEVERAYRKSQVPLEFLLVLGAMLFVLILLGWLLGFE